MKNLDQCDHNECDSKCTLHSVEPVRAVFRKYKEGDIIALFPDVRNERGVHNECMSYMHIGQHSEADYLGVVSDTVPAKPEEFAPLLRELTRIGYEVTPLRKFQRRRK